MTIMRVPISAVKRLNEQAGLYFFSRDTMRFFNSKTSRQAIHDTTTNKYYFVTSEQRESYCPRLYTARVMNPDCRTDDIGGFQAYVSERQAWDAIKHELGIR